MKTNIKFYIVEALFKLLNDKNLKDITVSDIVDSANISRTSFYNNFKNITDVLNYKFDLIISDLYNIFKLNKLRKNDINMLFREILKYIDNNKNKLSIIKNNFYLEFKDKLDIFFFSKINDRYKYIVYSGIILNLCLFYINNSYNIDIKKIKID